MRRSISYVVWKPKTIRQSFVVRLRAFVLRRKAGFLRSRLPASLFDGQGIPPTDEKGLTPLRCPCPDASVGYRICVIAKGPGCLQWLAHATEDGPFLSASISLRTFSSVRVVCRRYLDEKLVVMTSRTQLSFVSVHQSCSHAPLGYLWKGQYRHHCCI